MIVAHTVPETDAETVFDGRSSILFATIAGVSLGLMSGGPAGTTAGSRGRVARSVALRGLLLIILGLALTALDTPIAIILDTYGFLFLVAIPLLFAPRWVVAVVAAAAAFLGPPLVEALTTLIEGATGPAAAALASPWAFLPERWLVGTYPAPVWLAYIAIGILIARADVRERRTQLALMLTGVLAALVVYTTAAAARQPVLAHDDSTWEVLASGGVAIAVIGAFTWLTESSPERMRRVAPRALWPLQAAGSMPLTVYSVQIVLIWVYVEFIDDSTGWLEWQSLPLFFELALPLLLAASLWRLRFEQGPLEWLVSRITLQRSWRRGKGPSDWTSPPTHPTG